MVRTRDIMNNPVPIADGPVAMIAPLYSLFSNGYFANLRGGCAGRPINLHTLLHASMRSALSGQMVQKFSQNEA